MYELFLKIKMGFLYLYFFTAGIKKRNHFRKIRSGIRNNKKVES